MGNTGTTFKRLIIALLSLSPMIMNVSAQELQGSSPGQESLMPGKMQKHQAWMDSATKQLTRQLSEKLTMQLAQQLSGQLNKQFSEHMAEQAEDQLYNLKNTAITAHDETGLFLGEKKTPVIAAVISGQSE